MQIHKANIMNKNTTHRDLPLFAIIASVFKLGELTDKTLESLWRQADALTPRHEQNSLRLYRKAIEVGIDQKFIKRNTDGKLVITDAGRRWWSEKRRLSECPCSDSNYLRADWWAKARSLGA